MKILMINKTDSIGGAAQVMNNLTFGLRSKGHEVKYLVRRKFTHDNNVSELKDDPISGFLRKITGRDFPIVLSHWRDEVLGNDIDTGFSTEILNHPLIIWADVIHCHNLHGNYFKLDNLNSLSRKRAIVWTWHDWWPVTGHCATPQICHKYSQGCKHVHNYILNHKLDIYRRSNLKIVVPSMDMYRNVKLPNLDISMIHNGVLMTEYPEITKDKLKVQLGLPVNKKIVLFLTHGWKNYDKGWGYIVKSIESFPEYYWLGVGIKKAKKDGGVNYLEFLNQSDLQKYMKAADVFLFPSLAESFGMAVVEAMCQGTPVVAFPVGVVPELIDHKLNGYVAKYKSFDDLKNGLKYVLNRRMKTLSDQLINDFSINSMTENYLKVYERILSKD